MEFGALFALLLGLIVGSFLNVVALRYNTGRSLAGRSGCFSCGHKLRWYELIPVVSFINQEGRCRNCRSVISWQYPTVEFLTGILFLLIYFRFAPDSLLVTYYWVIAALLVVITVYDIKHKIIPDGLVYGFIFLALAGSYFALDRIKAAVILFLFFWVLWYFSAGKWMGFGDAKLAIGMGLLLGISGGISAVVLAFWLGAIVGLCLISLSKLKSRFTMKSEIPFAPFLVLGLLLNVLFEINVFPF